jgi:hypothetical protein
VLDNRSDVVVRKFRVLLGETMLYRIDLCYFGVTSIPPGLW